MNAAAIKRFYVETSDECGPFEYASFAAKEPAIQLAKDLVNSFPDAVVCDRREGVWLEKLGNPPRGDWQAHEQGQRTADRIDGYDRDDLGESPDF